MNKETKQGLVTEMHDKLLRANAVFLADFRGMTVPEVLLSGDHARIERWRREQAERLTRERRPDLWGEGPEGS